MNPSTVAKVLVALVTVALLVIGPVRMGLRDNVPSRVAARKRITLRVVNDSWAVGQPPDVINKNITSGLGGSIAITHRYSAHAPTVQTSIMIEGWLGNIPGGVAPNLTSHIENLRESKGVERRWVVLTFSDAPLRHPFDFTKVLAADIGENVRPGKRGGQFAGKGKGSYFPALAFLNHRLFIEHMVSSLRKLCSSQVSDLPIMCQDSDIALVQIYGVPQELVALRSEKFLKHRRGGALWLQPHFYKLLLLELFLPVSDFLFWIDNDALFMNWKLSLHGQLLKALRWSSKHQQRGNASESGWAERIHNVNESSFCMVFCRSGSPPSLNNGVGFYRGSLQGRDSTSTTAEAIVKGVWTVPTRSVGGAADNTALIAYLKSIPHGISSCVKMVPAFLMNAYPGDTLLGQYQRLLAYERNLTARIVSGKELVSRGFYDPDHFFRPGDWIMHAPGQRIRKSVAIRYFCFSLFWNNVTNDSIQGALAELTNVVLRLADDENRQTQAADDVAKIRVTCDKLISGTEPGHPLRPLPPDWTTD